MLAIAARSCFPPALRRRMRSGFYERVDGTYEAISAETVIRTRNCALS